MGKNCRSICVSFTILPFSCILYKYNPSLFLTVAVCPQPFYRSRRDYGPTPALPKCTAFGEGVTEGSPTGTMLRIVD